MVGPRELIREARALRRLMVRHAPNNNQRTAALFLSLGHHDTLIRRLHRAYRDRWRSWAARSKLTCRRRQAIRASAAQVSGSKARRASIATCYPKWRASGRRSSNRAKSTSANGRARAGSSGSAFRPSNPTRSNRELRSWPTRLHHCSDVELPPSNGAGHLYTALPAVAFGQIPLDHRAGPDHGIGASVPNRPPT